MFVKTILVGSIFVVTTLAQLHEDKRCRCVCPSPTAVFNNTEKLNRTLYIAFVPPHKCNCVGVILPKVTESIRDNAQIFCQRCDCNYETRNTTVIMVVVILVLWVLMLLIGYFLFLMLLKYLVIKKQKTYSRVDINSAEGENLLLQDEGTEE